MGGKDGVSHVVGEDRDTEHEWLKKSKGYELVVVLEEGALEEPGTRLFRF